MPRELFRFKRDLSGSYSRLTVPILGKHPACFHREIKGQFRKRVVFGECALVQVFVPGEHANVPSFRFSFRGEHPNVPSFRFPVGRRDRLMSRGKNCREAIFASHLSRDYPRRGVNFERGKKALSCGGETVWEAF